MNIRNKTAVISDPKGPFEEQISALLAEMTLEEKLSQITENWGIAGSPRVGVPPLYKSECVHGYSYGTGCTVFPQAIGMAATWDPEMVKKTAEVIGVESKAANAYQAWTPVLDVARDPRWGRVEESFGEDAYLVEKMGLAWIDGYQSLGLTATPKHFAAHGAPLGGRDSNIVGYSERTLREVHYPPFRAAVKKSKVKSLMSAYHVVDGVPCSGSREMLTKLLREEWGFNGYVVTDVGAPDHLFTKHTMATGATEAAAIMAKAGVDLCSTGDVFRDGIPAALEQGLIDMDDVDAMVGNVLRVKFELGLFDRPENPPLQWADVDEWDLPAHRKVALEAARAAMVLLKNENNLLPLSKEVGKIALVGPAAKTQEGGDYTCTLEEDQMVTIYEGLVDKVGRGNVLYARGCEFMNGDTAGIPEAVAAAEQADVVVVAVGDCARSSGENYDRASLHFTGAQDALIEAVCVTGKPVVLVAATGKPVILEYAAEHAAAILVSWFSGEEGGHAVADALFGEVNPGGKLPVTFPRSESQLPLFYNYHLSGRKYDYIDMPSVPRYRFGYGLSYTTFAYSNLRTEKDGENVKIYATVTNTGAVAGDEVAQLYITDMQTSVSTPVTTLKGFTRLTLQPGESREVCFTLTPYDLSLLDADLCRRVEKGEFRVFVGGMSPACNEGNEYRKARIAYENEAEGVMGAFTYDEDVAADFRLSLKKEDGAYLLTARNAGGLTDVLSADFYLNGKLYANRRRELDPGEEIVIAFYVEEEVADACVICRGQLVREVTA
ncbi:MAG: glycoside hydrolase family 3 C-terminal domain-containing protein [Clostridia bacterium]|nr:glycoside hydrolase family 3 C-terminal domain-containing protein [Clostridia bacterium]